MERPDSRSPDGSPIFDTLDLDLIVKVLAHTAFSPFFIFLIPIFYIFQGAKITDPIIVLSAIYYTAISLFWFSQWYSRLYRNQGSLFFGPGRFDWGEQVVVITGGASGIGELLANTLAVRNVNVVVLDVNPIVTENYNITYYKCDVSKWEDVEAVSQKVIEEIGHPTVLVNNAGVVQGKLILDLTPEDINQTFGVNTLAHFWTLKAFLPDMIKNKTGHIITMASIMSEVGVAQMSDYNASKAAVLSLTESLRCELDKRYDCPQIRTTAVIPGHVFTPMFSTLDVPQSFWYKFIFPSIQPIAVVKRIIAALDEQHSQTIRLPFYTHFVPYLAHFPSFVTDFAQWIAYSNHAMERFVKVSGRRADEGPILTNVKMD
ncbi:retinal short-chain dehydrogenase/reductase [Collybia nuda]|uniref:Short-chain dehydrogenase/reductase 3 n=1 Tax=Collybia nuda TaxID=64659 RepID=A0A9P5Y8Y0_9AGAR|nr:retinal short-chain dehydrogenase/reductase [Collybia nuda]